MIKRITIAAAVFVGGVLAGAPAAANTRHFSYTYESATLAPGQHELELWSTWRVGRSSFYSRFDERMEMEFGVTDRLQTALYLNFQGITRDVEGSLSSGSRFVGLSSEWKYRLSDPVADVLGAALYFEFSPGTDFIELETKIILDKRIGRWLFAFNGVCEYELEFSRPSVHQETYVEADLAGGFLLRPWLMAGFDLRQDFLFEGDEGLVSSTLSGGPTLALAGDGVWATATFLPQWAAFRGAHHPSLLDLNHHERYEARLLLGLHF